MAFVGGVAVAGLAALLLLKGTGNPVQPNFALPQQVPFVTQQQPIPQTQFPGQVQPAYPGQPVPVNPNDPLRLENEKMKAQLEALQRDNDLLKQANQQLQANLQNYNNYIQQNAAQQNAVAQAQAQQAATATPWWSSGVVWGVGGIVLTIGGGIVVAGVLSLFSNKERPSRTVQVIHPYPNPTPPIAPVRRTEFLPPRTEVRRVQSPEYDDMQ